jgi:hypothetical protein
LHKIVVQSTIYLLIGKIGWRKSFREANFFIYRF